MFNQTTSGDISNSPTTPRQQALELIKEEVKRLHPKVSREKLNELVQEEIQRLATIEPTELPRNIHEPSVRLTLGRDERSRITPVGERQDIVWGPPPPGQPSFRAGTVRPSDVTPLPADISSDPADILGQQHERQILQFQNESTQNESLLREQTDNRLRTLQEEFRIKADAMRQKYESIPLQQRTEEVNRRAQLEWDNLVRDMNLASTRIEGKIRPDLQRLQIAGQETLQDLQAKQLSDKFKLQTYKELADEGRLDPAEYKSLTLKLLGVNVPVSYLRSEVTTISDINQAISMTEDELERFAWGGFRGGRLHFRDIAEAKPEKASREEKQRFQELQDQLVLLRQEKAERIAREYEKSGRPDVAASFRKSFKLSGLEARKRQQYKGMGGFARGVAEAKDKATKKVTPISKVRLGKKTLTAEAARRFLRQYDGDVNKAQAAAQRSGYMW